MSVVVYKDGILAADSGVFKGDTRTGTARKIARNRHGAVAGGAGAYMAVRAFLDWFEGGEKGKFETKTDNFIGIIVDATGRVTFIDHAGARSGAADAAYHVIGSGEQIAVGALEMGATAICAVETVIAKHVFCNGPVASETIIKPEPDET